ncbi:unnamed protein product, partial [Nesidiocoris tenuis]
MCNRKRSKPQINLRLFFDELPEFDEWPENPKNKSKYSVMNPCKHTKTWKYPLYQLPIRYWSSFIISETMASVCNLRLQWLFV